MRLLDQAATHSFAAAQFHPGPLGEWVSSMTPGNRRAVFQQLVTDDLALSIALPTTYSAVDRVARIGLLLLERCANERGLSAGELGMLMSDPERELVESLALMVLDERRRPENEGAAVV